MIAPASPAESQHLEKETFSADVMTIVPQQAGQVPGNAPQPQPVPAPVTGLPEPGKQKTEEFHTEAYDRIYENPFLAAAQNPLSTFSIDVDTASYANMRRFLTQNTMPPKDSVRLEELINYFTYDYQPPQDNTPFASHIEITQCPWNVEHRLVRIALKGREIVMDKRPLSNLVFLLDVSGSMEDPNKLPLLKSGLKLLVDQLGENDRVAIVVYAGASGLVLPSTTCSHKEKVLAAMEELAAGGSTNGGEGIELAYRVAIENFIKGGTNRIILATDGDFNVGATDQGSLLRLIEEKAKSGVFLTVLGFGMGNYKDSTLEKLADKGNGNYAYIDTISEARKSLVEQMSGTLITIAKDVKIQVDFNPALVQAYRLLGYENRMLRAEDFKDDTKDAGEIGAGHTVTALYEIVPAGKPMSLPDVDPSKYQSQGQVTEAAKSGELLTVRIRYKEPTGDTSKPLEFPVQEQMKKLTQSSQDFRFAAAVALFGMILRDSKYKGNGTLDLVWELAAEAKGEDKGGYRAEFLQLVKKAQEISKR
jgi:Ca-activated chloride channel family protein